MHYCTCLVQHCCGGGTSCTPSCWACQTVLCKMLCCARSRPSAGAGEIGIVTHPQMCEYGEVHTVVLGGGPARPTRHLALARAADRACYSHAGLVRGWVGTAVAALGRGPHVPWAAGTVAVPGPSTYQVRHIHHPDMAPRLCCPIHSRAVSAPSRLRPRGRTGLTCRSGPRASRAG